MSGDANPLARHGGLSYLEIPALDPGRSAAFYEALLGWRIERRSDRDLRFASPDGLLIGRWVTDRGAARDSGLVPFIYIDGLDVGVARVVAGGGEIVEAPRPEGLWQFTPG